MALLYLMNSHPMDAVTAKFGGIFFEIWLSKRDNASSVAQDEHPVG
jgi:hypothetical protein